MKIDIKKECGRQIVSRKDGLKIRQLLIHNWGKRGKIIINFDNVLVASVSFIDEAFGKLAKKYKREELQQKLVFENMLVYDKALLNDILLSRYLQEVSKKKQHAKHKHA